jgi:hypothetical protein
MYTRLIFGKELKEKVKKREPLLEIGVWAHSTYLNYIDDVDLDFREILLTLNTMELGPEFAFTYEELNKIADDLIAGKDVHL